MIKTILLRTIIVGIVSFLFGCCLAYSTRALYFNWLYNLVLYSTLNTINYPPIRNATNFDPIINDIESHLPVNHPYRDNDRVTWVHEGSHGIASQLRNQFGKPGFYLLENRAIILDRELLTTIGEVAKLVPVSLRGEVYQLYLVQSRRWWEHEPSYIFDEFVAYTNGSEARRQLCISSRGETIRYMLEFIVYSTSVIRSDKNTNLQTRLFIMWQIERAIKIYKQSGMSSNYLIQLRISPDANEFRQYMREYFGAKWTKQMLGF